MSGRLTEEELARLVAGGSVRVIRTNSPAIAAAAESAGDAGVKSWGFPPTAVVAPPAPAQPDPALWGPRAGVDAFAQELRAARAGLILVGFEVAGLPIAQPRPRRAKTMPGQKPRVFTPDGRVRPWKDAIAFELRRSGSVPAMPALGAVRLRLRFWMPRPASHFAKDRSVRPWALGVPHTSAPDVDNLAKAVMDVLTRELVYADDAQVNELLVVREWAPGRTGGLQVRLAAEASPPADRRPRRLKKG